MGFNSSKFKFFCSYAYTHKKQKRHHFLIKWFFGGFRIFIINLFIGFIWLCEAGVAILIHHEHTKFFIEDTKWL